MAVNNNTQPRIESVASRIGILLMATLLIAGFAKYAGNEIKSSSAATLGSAGDIYISSAKNASDLVGDGSQAKPYRSISKALSSRSVGSYTIRVASQPYVLSSPCCRTTVGGPLHGRGSAYYCF